MRNLKHVLVLLAFSVTARAAAPSATPAGTLAPNEKLDKNVLQRTRLNDEVMRLSQPLKCSSDTDCGTLAMGVKPCGGPWKFVVYSKKNSRVPTLKKKLDEYNKLDQSINESQQLMSDCSVSVAPDVKCVHNVCVDTAGANAANARAGLEKVQPAAAPKR